MDEERDARRLGTLTRVLAGIAIGLAAALVVGTVYALVAKAAGPGRDAAAEAPTDEESTMSLGSVRFSPTDDSAAVYGVEVVVAWIGDDPAFASELESKRAELAATAMAWLSSRSSMELSPSSVGAIKAGLRAAFDERLALGKVSSVYFPKFQRF